MDTSYSLETESVTYNGGNAIPAAGGSFSPTVKVILRTLLNGVITNSEYVTIATQDCAYQTAGDTWLTLDDTHTGVITAAVNTTTSVRSSTVSAIYAYTAPDGTSLTTPSYTVTITLSAGDEETAKISFGESELVWVKDSNDPPSFNIDNIDFISFSADATFYNTVGSDTHVIAWQDNAYSCVGYDLVSYLPCTVVDTQYWSTATHLLSVGLSFTTADNALYTTNCGITAVIQYITIDDATQQQTVVYTSPSIDVKCNDDEKLMWILDAYNVENANIAIADGSSCYIHITLTVSGGTSKTNIEYGTPNVTLNYATIPSSGGTVEPTYSYSQEYTINGVSLRPINTGANLQFIIL